MATEIKRPLSSYMLFAADVREIIRAENPGAGVAVIGKLIGERWKTLRPDEKKEYEDRHAADKKAYEEAVAAQGIATPPAKQSGGDNDDEDDEDVRLPLSKIKKIIKLDPETPRMSGDAVYMVAVATELLLQQLTHEAAAVATERGKKTITDVDIARAAARIEGLHFLKHDLRVPTAAEEAAVKAAKQADRPAAKAGAGAGAGQGQEQAGAGEEGGQDAMAVDGEDAEAGAGSSSGAKSAPAGPSLLTLFQRIKDAGPQAPVRRVKLADARDKDTEGQEEDKDEEDEEEGAGAGASSSSKAKAADGAGAGSSSKAGQGKAGAASSKPKPMAVSLDKFMVRVGSKEEATARLVAQMEQAHAGDVVAPPQARQPKSKKPSSAGGAKRVQFVDGDRDVEDIDDDEDGAGAGGGSGAAANSEEDDEFDLGFIRRKVKGKGKAKARKGGARKGAKAGAGAGASPDEDMDEDEHDAGEGEAEVDDQAGAGGAGAGSSGSTGATSGARSRENVALQYEAPEDDIQED